MKSIFILAFCLLLLAVTFISCKKELECYDCKENKPPVANAGVDQTIILPKDSVILDGSASTDLDGTITSYKWIKISGPASANIANVTSSKTWVKSLVQGVYQFELIVADNGGLSSKDTVRVMVDGPGNQPPVACAGANQTITLPTNSVTLDGSCSVDPDNNITAYAWTKIAGPDANVANANAVHTLVTGLVQGIYQFELKVTDVAGLFSTDTIQLTVNDIIANCDINGREVFNATLTEIGRLSEPRITAVGSAGSKIVFAGGVKEFVCGLDIEVSSSAVDIYDINTHIWSRTKLSKERSHISAVSSNNKIFFAGGVNWDNHPGGGQWNVSYANVDIYNVSTNTWSVAHLSKARESICAVAIGNKVIFAGGTYFTGNPFSNKVWDVTDVVDIYDLSTNSWSATKLSFPRTDISAVVIGDKVYFAGGWGYAAGSYGDLNAVDVYNSSTNTWSTSNLPDDVALKDSYQIAKYVTWAKDNLIKIKNVNSGVITNNCVSGNVFNITGLKNERIVFFTGFNSNNSAITQFDFYNTLTGNWSIGKVNQSMAGTRYARTVTVNNNVYLAGGVSGTDGCNLTFHDKVYLLNW